MGTSLWLEPEQNWQMAHSLWQAPRPGTTYRLISGTLHQELCFIEPQNSPAQYTF